MTKKASNSNRVIPGRIDSYYRPSPGRSIEQILMDFKSREEGIQGRMSSTPGTPAAEMLAYKTTGALCFTPDDEDNQKIIKASAVSPSFYGLISHQVNEIGFSLTFIKIKPKKMESLINDFQAEFGNPLNFLIQAAGSRETKGYERQFSIGHTIFRPSDIEDPRYLYLRRCASYQFYDSTHRGDGIQYFKRKPRDAQARSELVELLKLLTPLDKKRLDEWGEPFWESWAAYLGESTWPLFSPSDSSSIVDPYLVHPKDIAITLGFLTKNYHFETGRPLKLISGSALSWLMVQVEGQTLSMTVKITAADHFPAARQWVEQAIGASISDYRWNVGWDQPIDLGLADLEAPILINGYQARNK